MIPIRASAEAREQYVQNIVDAWRSVTPVQEAEGRAWYRVAHDLASEIADGDVRLGAGVIAALSANKSWTANCRLARAACGPGLSSGHFHDALAKAKRIAAGAAPESVLPMALKTGQFFRCIADPDDPDAVVIDRHAHDIAVCERYGSRDRGLSVPSRYALLADCYRDAARRLGERPSVVQAVTWVAHVQSSRSRPHDEGAQPRSQTAA